MNKTTKLVCMLEPNIAESVRDLADKNKISCSNLIRRLLIDELRQQGLLSDDYAASMLRGG